MSLLSNVKVLYRLSLIAVLVCFKHVTQGAKYSCQVSISVSEGSPANIFCNFSEDVQVTKKNVKIHKIEGQFQTDAVVVAECFWSDAQSFRCDQRSGYTLQGEITNRATLAIPRATKAFEGKYMCELVPSEPSEIEPCEFRLEERADATNLSAPDMRSLIIAAIAISALSLVIVVLSIFLRDCIIACTQQLQYKSRRHRKSGSNVKKCEEGDPLVKDDVPHITVGDKSTGTDDKSFSHLSEIVQNSVTSALLEVAHTRTGALIISTMSEIHRNSQTQKVIHSSQQAQQSTGGVVNKSTASSGKDNPRDQPIGSKPQGSSQHKNANMNTTEGTSKPRSDKGAVGHSSAPVAGTPSDSPGPQEAPSTRSDGEGNVTGAQVRPFTQTSKSKNIASQRGSRKGKDESVDAKNEETLGKKKERTVFIP